MRIIDISPELHAKTAVFPGDKPFRRDISMSFEEGDALLLSSIESTLHIGAHADAPNHYTKTGKGIEARVLNFYLGECQVVDLSKDVRQLEQLHDTPSAAISLGRGERIYPEHFSGVEISAKRVLIKTKSFPNPDEWNDDFNSLSPELVEFLFKQGVRLIGIDTPSIDLASDKVLLSHNAIASYDMAVLEGIVLDHVQSGNYTLIALPLKIKNADASPVRAVLVDEIWCK